MAPIRPGCLATPVSSLVYQDQRDNDLIHNNVGLLHCKSKRLEVTDVKINPHLKVPWDLVLYDMISCVTLTGDQLIIKSFGSPGICAWHLFTGKIRWQVKGRLAGMRNWMTTRGIDTDGRGHLFVCDTANQCIQLFSLNGDYLGVLLRSGEQYLGTPFGIRWCCMTGSAIVLHHRNQDRCYLSVYTQKFIESM